MSFYDGWELISATEHEPFSENALLFSVEHIFLTKDAEEAEKLFSAIEHCRTAPGIYDQHPSHLLTGNERYMSRDQLLAILAFSYYTGYYFHKELWKEIKNQWLRYNNVEVPNSWWKKLTNPRFFLPQDVIFAGYCAGNFGCKLLLPILWFAMLVSSLRDYKVRNGQKILATDSKLLNFIMLQATKDRSWIWDKMWKLHTYIMKKKFGSWNAVFKIYFPFSNHPNVVDSANI